MKFLGFPVGASSNVELTVTGILKKWQLIFYGTATNPIRIRTRQFNPVQTNSYPYYNAPSYGYPALRATAPELQSDIDFFRPSAFQGYQGPYVGSASNVDASVATLDGSSAPILTNRLPGDAGTAADDVSRSLQGSLDPSRRILHDCDPQCDHQGCYGKGPTQCVGCKTYRLDKCVQKNKKKRKKKKISSFTILRSFEIMH